MNRYYYISDNLDVLEELQIDLENHGVDTERIHVLTEQETEVRDRHINKVESLAKQDMIRYGLRGAVVGVGLALAILVIALVVGLMDTVWAVPILFLAAVVLGFCTWEGGFIGAQVPNEEYRRFQDDLNHGRHVLFLDIEDNEKNHLDQAISTRPQLKHAGTGKPEPSTTWHFRRWVRHMIRTLP
jgi:hypothetical protein